MWGPSSRNSRMVQASLSAEEFVGLFHYLPIIDKRKWSRDSFVCYIVLGYPLSDIEASEDVRNLTEPSLLFLEQSEPSQCLSPPPK